MARIEGDRWIIETEEEAEAIAKLLNEPSKVNEKMQEALAAYRNLGYGESLDNLDLFVQIQAVTHCKEDRVTEQNIEDNFTYTRLEQAVKNLTPVCSNCHRQIHSEEY